MYTGAIYCRLALNSLSPRKNIRVCRVAQRKRFDEHRGVSGREFGQPAASFVVSIEMAFSI